MTPLELKPGDKLAGRYTIQRVLGKGGFGTVFLAVQDAIQRWVAIKALRPDLAAEKSRLREAFRDEAIHTSRLRHPNTVTIIGFEETPDGGLYLVMEYIKGVSLGTVIDRHGAISLPVALSLIIQIAKSLAEAHDIGLIHGDLKPDNVMVCEHYGDPHFVKVLDFGIARVMGVPTDVIVGTPGYMAPEQLTGDPIGPQADVYALGRVLYEMLTGSNAEATQVTLRLDEGDTDASPHNLDGVSWIIERATEFDPADRFADAAEVLAQLLTLRDGLSTPGGSWRLPAFDDEPEEIVVEGGDSEIFGGEGPDEINGEGETDWSQPGEPPLLSLDLSAEAEGDPTLRGREVDQWLIESAMEDMLASGKGIVLSIVGPSSSGRSSLARWLFDVAAARPELCVGLGNYEGGAFTGPVGLADALAAALGCPNKSTGHHNFAQISAALTERSGVRLSVHERAVLLGFIGWSNGPAPPGAEATLARLIAEAAEACPMVLILDNLEAADELTLKIIEALAVIIDERSTPLMLVCAQVDTGEVLARMEKIALRRSCVMRADLSPLSDSTQKTIINAQFARHHREGSPEVIPSPALVGFVADCCGGLPGLIQAQVVHLCAARVLRSSEAGLILAPKAKAAAILPPIVEDRLLAALLERLGAPSQRRDDLIFILLRISVLGGALPGSLLREQLLAEQRRGHLCAQRVLRERGALLRELIKLNLLERVYESEGGRQLVRFCSDATRRAVERLSDDLSDARAVHQLAARAKAAVLKQRPGQPLGGMTMVEHLAHSSQLAQGIPRPGWPVHHDCWRR